MKSLITLAVLLAACTSLLAQKVEYRDGLVSVDKQPVAKIVSTKNPDMMGLVKNFAATNLAGDTLFTAVYSSLIPEDPDDNTVYYFEFRFRGYDTPGFLPVSKLGGEKTLANHIGNFGLVKDQQLDLNAVRALIQKKGKTPPYRLNYTMVTRNRQFPVEIREPGKISQAGTLIGLFADLGTQSGVDTYNFQIPAGTLIATATFSGGNQARVVTVKTYRDNITHTVAASGESVTLIAGVDRNVLILKQIAQWLVTQNYL
ncbi:MAG: hypothetical protein SF053_08045 [Bacteroidia bacterium]|nr:hypothetical protein [Bacteroidia bacterium]